MQDIIAKLIAKDINMLVPLLIKSFQKVRILTNGTNTLMSLLRYLTVTEK